MTTVELRKTLKRRIDHLPADRLRSAADYLAFLDDAERLSPVATAMKARIRQAEAEIAHGLATPVSQLKRKS